MVVGIETFRRYFAAHGDQYVLIGGAACDLLFTAAGLPYRATKDLDIVLCVEVVDAAFARTFADFLDAAGYQKHALYEGERKFYRFEKPTDTRFPYMIELFARPTAALDLPGSDRYVRLTVEDAILSLSALLLDEHYYAAVQNGRETLDGVSILGPTLLVPFKARAFLDLSQRRSEGEQVDSDDIRKHRNDIFRLVQLLPGAGTVALADPIKDDLRRFIAAMPDEELDPKSFTVPLTKEEGVAILQRVYGLAPGPGEEDV